MIDSSKEEMIKKIILENGWLDRIDEISFLAAGEYNENYLICSESRSTQPDPTQIPHGDSVHQRQYLFRINHGSQIEQENQIGYEYHVLERVQPSGVTPIPYNVAPKTSLGGVLLMEFIPGRPFTFDQDLDKVPQVFAAIHTVPTTIETVPNLSSSATTAWDDPPSQASLAMINDDPSKSEQIPSHSFLQDQLPPLLVQADPIGDIAAESFRLIHRFKAHPLKEVHCLLMKYHESILRLQDQKKTLFSNESLCLVNTEVNSGNFIVQGDRAFLVDWEKAVISYRYQDLAHFIIPTTTLWKTDFRFTPDGRKRFLRQYHNLISRGDGADTPRFDIPLLDIPFDALDDKTAVLEKTILLRALSWCYMAWYEYTHQDSGQRGLTHDTTFQKINSYLENIECFLK